MCLTRLRICNTKSYTGQVDCVICCIDCMTQLSNGTPQWHRNWLQGFLSFWDTKDVMAIEIVLDLPSVLQICT